ncbi:MAG: glycosyltransferase family 2 protein [Bacteroidetes bacterium]|nr:glycosyltransferase family 2 protein [Bacteroidota bacterium]MBU1799354.1 glycosyltransferase family 2 protein [Bacteroidota bacterium]
MPKLTLSMIVKNEEANLRDCLESIKDIVDEIVIVDTGSTDKTLKIAEEFGAKIFRFNWINDFSAARNFALKQSTGDWILYLDADERLERRSKLELSNLLPKNALTGVNCLINNIDEITGTPKFMKYIRLFSNSANINFSGKAHEQIEASLLENGYSIVSSKIEIIHLGYNVGKVELKKKAERNLLPLLEEYLSNPSSYYAFQLANTYKVIGDRPNEIKYHQIAIQDPKLKNEYKAIGYLTLADYSMRDNNINLALDYVTVGLELDKNHPLLNLVASQVHNSINEKSKAIQFCKTALIENRKIKNKENITNSIDVIVPEEKILKHGLYLSVSSENEYMFNYFLSELSKLRSSDKLEMEFIEKLHNFIELNENELVYLSQIIDVDSLDLYLLLISRIESIQSQLNSLLFLNDKFETNSKFLTKLGLMLNENGYSSEAAQVFERSLKLEVKDPSQVFYLISIYVNENKYDKIPELLEFALNEFSHIVGVKDKLHSVIKKLEPILIN